MDRVAASFPGLATTRIGLASVGVLGAAPVDLDGHGLVIGPLYERATMRRVTRLAPAELAALVQHGAGLLVERYWGAWLALLSGEEGLTAARAPLGELPCYTLRTGNLDILASDLDLIAATSLHRPAVDWDQVRLLLATGEFHRFETCLEGIGELPGGHALAIRSERREPTMLWSPWSFAARHGHRDRRDDAVAMVRAAVLDSVAARASCFDKVLLLLSGGLDSSILAAALRQTGVAIEALNLVTRDAAGDERAHARRVAEWLSIPLVEMRREVERIDIHRSPAQGLPRPSIRLFRQESARLATLAGECSGAAAVFDGGGGDNVFCSLKSSAPAADRLITTGPGPAFWRVVREISRHAPASMGEVAFDAMRRAWLARPSIPPLNDLSLLAPGAGGALPGGRDHPWLRCPGAALPGSAGHVRLVAIGQGHVESLDPRRDTPAISPLLSQPVVEACLRVPSWLWLENGANRAIARRGFSHLLPLDIVARRSKGSPNSFSAEIFEVHRQAIRDMLADGLLVSRRIIDREAVLAVLDDRRPPMSDAFQRILHFVDCEAWARSW